jgi:hypothetical protein
MHAIKFIFHGIFMSSHVFMHIYVMAERKQQIWKPQHDLFHTVRQKSKLKLIAN